jgi:sialidase-1
MSIPSARHTPTRRRRGALPALAALASALLIAAASPASAAAPGSAAQGSAAQGSAAQGSAAQGNAAQDSAAQGAHSPTAHTPPAPSLTQQVLFSPAQDPGYTCYRIPAIVKSTHGTLLAFAEGRIDNCGDAGDIDVVVKRSTDGGHTWSPLQVVNRGNGDTHDQPTPIVDTRTGRVILITNVNPGRTDSAGCTAPCDRTAHLQYSDDDGLTWSAPRDITSQVKQPGWDWWFVTGPGHAIQLTQGPHAGRLVIGMSAESSNGAGSSVANHGALAYSDDHGMTWHVGAVDTIDFPAGGTFAQKPSELSIAELPGGAIYAAAREQSGTDIGNRSYAISRDGGRTWSTPFTTIPDLVTPMVQGSVLQLRTQKGGRLLFSSPANTDVRKTMMIRSSYDDGRTWENADQGTVISDDLAGYSDMVQLSDPRASDTLVGLMYEAGKVTYSDEIRFAVFNTEDLGYRNSAGPRTPDLASPHSDSNVLGGATLGAGRFGGALTLDGNDDYVRVPYRPAQLPGSGDFTWTAWFNYGAATGNQVIMWLGGMNSSAPQVWLRGEPANHRLLATMTTPKGTKMISSTSAYNDQTWHFVALERSGDQLLMWVDGIQVAAGPAVAGSVSQTVSFQIQVGQRLDGAFNFDGSLDEVRAYNRALPTTELDAVRVQNAALPAGLVLRLPFDQIKPARK